MILAVPLLMSTFFLQPGDRVVFYGDSITEQRMYSTYVEAFVATRYPNLDVQFFNRGWAGDASWGGGGGTPEERVRRDVAPLKPTVTFVMLGMNDGGYFPYDAKVEAVIREWYGKTLDALTKGGWNTRLTLARTSPWDDVAHHFDSVGKPPEPWSGWKGYNDVLQKYGQVVVDEAKKRGASYVDFNQPLVNVLSLATAKDAEKAKQIIPDSIHPAAPGHLVMAAELLKAWNADPVVSKVEIDAIAGTVTALDHAKVSGWKDLSWTQLDPCLPFVLDPANGVVSMVEDLSQFHRALNQQTLRVTGLLPGRYALMIDKQKVVVLSNEEWAAGVNLALFDTPMRRQSLEVLELVRKRVETDFVAWRTVQRENMGPKAERAYAALQELSKEQAKGIRKAAKPLPHQYQLTPEQ